ncbi:hypothetical protein FOB23_13540 [Parabacteroides distasonis]|uniref:Uncharacterized protein n=2 Tax=Parabacteroides distasonis TaxID=823 RepID=A6L8D5_PARD8|nr:hypothetical protein BDI_0159 [Parabacteroides distasonis ATCC 8503]EFK63792.1 hypothetical protein HMPREF9008_03273 [Parabacteroides sp. 20_3]MBD9081162.1 hypothetical protein [Parabacteroides distasonis]MBS1425911.1 hypothetical protein [Parabacteroides sp.]RGD05413.1 hypothetical protein DW215_11025 [Parabacteroides sp. AM18-12LB]RGD14561.1 hypothetical protein DW665_17660 [Parabacteroides sp. AM25-14]RGD28475.1 hypothetical protein DW205_16060 [Parabacteroides sp. AM17-47]RKU53886.1 h
MVNKTTIYIKKGEVRKDPAFLCYCSQLVCSIGTGVISVLVSSTNVVPRNNQIIKRIIATTTPNTNSVFTLFFLMSLTDLFILE